MSDTHTQKELRKQMKDKELTQLYSSVGKYYLLQVKQLQVWLEKETKQEKGKKKKEKKEKFWGDRLYA